MKRWIKASFATVSTVALLGVAACSNGGGSSSNSADSKDSGSKEGSKAVATAPKVKCDIPEENLTGDAFDLDKAEGEITFQTQGLKGTFDGFFTKAIADFEAANPGITIKWTDLPGDADFDTKMVTQASSCQMADVINVPSSTIVALTKKNLLLNLDAKAPGYGKIYSPGVWETTAFGENNSHTAYPWYFGPFATTYNKAVFERAGLDPEKPPTNMDEYFEMAHKIAEANKDKGSDKDYAVYGNTTWYMGQQWNNTGGKVMNDDATKFVFADDPHILNWVENMAQLYKEGGIPKDSMTGDLDMTKAFSEGHLAFGTPNVSFLKTIKKNAPEVYANTGVSREMLPAGQKPTFAGQFIAVAVTSPKAPAAVKFANYIAGEEQGLAWAKYGIETKTAVVFPVSTKALNDPSLTESGDDSDAIFTQGRKIAAEEAKEAESNPTVFYLTGEVRNIMIKEVNAAIIGQKDPQEALTSAQEQMNKLLDKLNK